ncbi:MAG: AmiS/UreI family transporter [Alicyclobacillus macrosporangiidus]|uniref:AmiS/UreI family transporter n=1 Tax=Alicyclobacillus macrosporangiidus TaxID=392015 RepID=UPI0026F07C78|nr:AmiS/UreI family transporter [Alicyclobacillus macrosporangiidus]MCL6598497.1 AmiS/UreI family transporter [Alicyclobacillus macrosporangiidus]
MANVGLLYVGAVLFINGLMLLGYIQPKSAAIFNLFVGALQVITPLYIIVTHINSPWDIFGASGIFLFGFTYLFVGITNLVSIEGSGLGWYCLWVAIMALGYSTLNFTHFSDAKFGIIWILWAFLWFLFYLLLAQNKDIARFTGWVTLIESWTTCTIPAFLSMTGVWTSISNGLAWTCAVVVVIVFVLAYVFSKGRPRNVTTSQAL